MSAEVPLPVLAPETTPSDSPAGSPAPAAEPGDAAILAVLRLARAKPRPRD